MGCLFSCFRVKDDPRPQINPVSQPVTPTEPVDSLTSNSLWSVLVPEAEDNHQSQDKDARSGLTGSPGADDGLRAEAKFLKACGTLPQTPHEIRNSEKFTDSQPPSGDMEATFQSWLPNTTTEKPLEKQLDQLHPPIKLFEDWENDTDSSPHSPNKYTTGKSTDSSRTSSSEGCMVIDPVKDVQTLNPLTSHTPMVASTQCKNKSVRFESESDTSSSSSKSNLEKVTDQNLKPSPYPTPLKLTNDMETPGTVFPSYVYNKESGMNPRIRLQYVYSGVDPEIYQRLEQPIEETPQSQIHWNNNRNGDKISWWDGNGIQNTTNKYKEDQKVSWHATPFEERLAKALSDDKRKQIGDTSPIRF